jgi:hypothetical protein
MFVTSTALFQLGRYHFLMKLEISLISVSTMITAHLLIQQSALASVINILWMCFQFTLNFPT